MASACERSGKPQKQSCVDAVCHANDAHADHIADATRRMRAPPKRAENRLRSRDDLVQQIRAVQGDDHEPPAAVDHVLPARDWAVVGIVVMRRAAIPFASAEATLLNKQACTGTAATRPQGTTASKATQVQVVRRCIVQTSGVQHAEDAATQ
jgi:hypothetical protein